MNDREIETISFTKYRELAEMTRNGHASVTLMYGNQKKQFWGTPASKQVCHSIISFYELLVLLNYWYNPNKGLCNYRNREDRHIKIQICRTRIFEMHTFTSIIWRHLIIWFSFIMDILQRKYRWGGCYLKGLQIIIRERQKGYMEVDIINKRDRPINNLLTVI